MRILDRIFKKKHGVCSECGVHFEPVTGYEARWGNLCQTHRKPVKERDEKKDATIVWATANWERISLIMAEEEKANREAYNKAMTSVMNKQTSDKQIAYLQQASLNRGLYGFGGL